MKPPKFPKPPRRPSPDAVQVNEARLEIDHLLTECLRLFRSLADYCLPIQGDHPVMIEHRRRTLAAVRAALKAANDETLTPEDHALLTLLVNGADVRF